MKKTLLSALFLAAGLTAQAQLPNGSQAPDFTATDINGETHHLQEYLDAGKTVIIDISATWCGPCWNYHGSNALADLYESFGPGGTNDVVVLFIEGDPGTSVQSIYGTNAPSDTSTTRGDWTAHSPYPIIDDGDGSISDAYNIAYFPTVYMICPSGIVKELQQPTVNALKTQINANCQPLTGSVLTDKARPDNTSVIYCEAEGEYKAKIKNLGTNKIFTATLALKQNGTVVASKSYSSTTGLNQYSNTPTLTFDNYSFVEGAEYTTEITEINGDTTLPFPDVASAEAKITINNAVEVDNNITVAIHTDYYPGEASWEIRTVEGNTIVASGGDYEFNANAQGQDLGGGPDANTIKTSTITLPEGIDCYKVILKDTYGDGWIYGSDGEVDTSEFHGIKLYNGEELVYEQSVSTFTFSNATFDAALISTGVLGVNQPVATNAFTLYPNPTTGILNIRTPESIELTVTDLAGKTVFRAAAVEDGGSVNLSVLQKGMYIATLKGSTGIKTEKIIIN